MAKYTSTSDLYLGKKKGGFVKAGTVFEFSGKPNKSMKPVTPATEEKDAGKGKKGTPAGKDKDAPGGKSTGDQEVI